MPTPAISRTASARTTAAAAARGPLAPRKFKRDAEVAELQTFLADGAWNGVAARAMIVPANCVMHIKHHDYGTHKPQTAKVTKAPKDGIVDATMIISASGHVGDEALERYRKTNVYTIEITYPNGKTERMTGIKAKGEYATAQDISFQLMKGKTIIQAYPNGTGAGGYVEGRRIEITY